MPICCRRTTSTRLSGRSARFPGSSVTARSPARLRGLAETLVAVVSRSPDTRGLGKGPSTGRAASGRRLRRVCLATLAATGCSAVLTTPQVDAIHSFAAASAPYPTLPGSLFRAYADLHASREMLEASTARVADAPLSLEQLHKGLSLAANIDAQAQELDKALGILTDYSAALGALSSDAVLADLDSAASTFGSALDTAIAQYNTLPAAQGSPLPSPGSGAATAARSLGGIWVRHRQAAYLYEFVIKADPTLQLLLPRILAMVKSFYDPSHPDAGRLADEVKSFDKAFRTYFAFQETTVLSQGDVGCPKEEVKCLKAALSGYAALSDNKLRVADVQVFFLWLRGEQEATTLALSVLRATETLAKAHHALAAAMSPDTSLSAAVAEIQALVKEVKAGLAAGQKVPASPAT
jgi:hypothetical protein